DEYTLAGGIANATPLYTTTVYDKDGNVLSVTDPRGITTSYAYDALGRQTEEIDEYTLAGGIANATPLYTTTVYDKDGNVLSVDDPRGITTSYAYDALGRQTE